MSRLRDEKMKRIVVIPLACGACFNKRNLRKRAAKLLTLLDPRYFSFAFGSAAGMTIGKIG